MPRSGGGDKWWFAVDANDATVKFKNIFFL